MPTSSRSRRAVSADRALRVHLPESHSSRILRLSDAVLVGRDPSCDLRLDDRRISRRHVRLHRVGGQWWVCDVDSADGTYLDDDCIDAAPILGPCTLRLGPEGPALRLEPAA